MDVMLDTGPAELLHSFRERLRFPRLSVSHIPQMLPGPAWQWRPLPANDAQLASTIAGEAAHAALLNRFLPRMAQYRLNRHQARAQQSMRLLQHAADQQRRTYQAISNLLATLGVL